MSYPVTEPIQNSEMETGVTSREMLTIDRDSCGSYSSNVAMRPSVSVAQLDRASASEAEEAKFQVHTGKKLRRLKNPVAPAVAPADPNLGGNDFKTALDMLARLPLSDAERAEAIRRLLGLGQ